jgi:uncharacterized protein (DUF924 family)
MTDRHSLAPPSSEASAVLAHWFGPVPAWREIWFLADPTFDEELRSQFGALLPQATSGALDAWGNRAAGAVALCLLLDQFPRNLHRGTARAYATNGKARALAGSALARGLDQAVPALWRQFLYLPFMHSEDLDDQERSVALHAGLGSEDWAAECHMYALRHRAVIARFGRYPSRNRALGRASTAEELAFLAMTPEGF